MATNYNAKIASVQDEIRRLQNLAKEYEQKQKKEERKARDHRVYQRGGYLEKVLPGTVALTEENFRTWFDLAIANDTARELLSEVLAEQEKQAAAENAATVPPQSLSPAGGLNDQTHRQGGEKPADTPPRATAPSNTPTANQPAGAAQNNAANAAAKQPDTAHTAG